MSGHSAVIEFVFPGGGDAEAALHGLEAAIEGFEAIATYEARAEGRRVRVRLWLRDGAGDDDQRVAEQLLEDWAGSSGGRAA